MVALSGLDHASRTQPFIWTVRMAVSLEQGSCGAVRLTTPWDEKQNSQKSVHHQPSSAVDSCECYIV